jgi:hypothetical protein
MSNLNLSKIQAIRRHRDTYECLKKSTAASYWCRNQPSLEGLSLVEGLFSPYRILVVSDSSEAGLEKLLVGR